MVDSCGRFKGLVVDVRVLPNGELLYDIDYQDGEVEEGLPEKFVRPVVKPGKKGV
jgi:hypothetical protein